MAKNSQNTPSSLKNLISPNLKVLSSKILKDGDELRLIGGLVRDYLADKKNTTAKKLDYDLACKFLPEETLKILKQHKIKALPTGIKHGTITALIGNEEYQITTLRKDVENFGRHAKVEFVDDFFEDAKRRDFTINAMSIDFNGQLYDYFDGLKDLKAGNVCFIGDAETRIGEDYLRILRFFRFNAKYGKNIDRFGKNIS